MVNFLPLKTKRLHHKEPPMVETLKCNPDPDRNPRFHTSRIKQIIHENHLFSYNHPQVQIKDIIPLRLFTACFSDN